jgi:hypothetical protein
MTDKMIKNIDFKQMFNDLGSIAEIAGTAYDQEAVRQVVNAYKPMFATFPVGIRVTTKPAQYRDVSLRYLHPLNNTDPFGIAVEHGLFAQDHHPVESLIPEVQASFDMEGYGVDMGISHGLEKIWPLFSPVPIEAVAALPSAPPGIKAHADYFAKNNLRACNILTVDFWHKTMNVYVLQPPGTLTPDTVAAHIGDLGFQVPSQEELEINTRAFIVYHTFSWDSPEVQRICYAMVAPTPDMVPVHLHPLVEKVVAEARFQADHRRFLYCLTYAPSGDYIKIEVDYRGTLSLTMRDAMSRLRS